MRVARGNKSIRRVEGLGLEEKTGGGGLSFKRNYGAASVGE